MHPSNATPVSADQQDLIEVIDFAFDFTAVVKKAKADGGGFNFRDWSKFLGLFDEGALAINGAENIWTNFNHASPADRLPIVQHFAEKFSVSNQVAERKIEKAVALVFAAYALATDQDGDDSTANV